MLMYINSSYGLIRGGGGSIRSKIDFTIFLKCRIKFFFFVPQQLKICTNFTNFIRKTDVIDSSCVNGVRCNSDCSYGSDGRGWIEEVVVVFYILAVRVELQLQIVLSQLRRICITTTLVFNVKQLA